MSINQKINLLRYKSFKLFFALFLLLPGFSKAQFGEPFGPQSSEIKRSPVRKVLNLLSFTASSGYGLTKYKHNISGFTLMQKQSGVKYLIQDFQYTLPNIGYNDWLQNPAPINDIRHDSEDFLVNPDTTDIGFRGFGNSVPINLSIHIDIENFRIGGGVSAEFHSLSKFSPLYHEEELTQFEPEYKKAIFTRWFGTIGYKAHNYRDYSFVPEIQFGKLNLGQDYNNEIIENSMFINVGVSIEKNFSEYFRAIIRPSIEFKNYTFNFGETTSIVHKQPAFYITAGLSLNYPEVPRCKIKSCQTQLKHVHGGKEFRGQPIWKKQNPKYGENHQDLIKYKGRNKRIRSPF